MLPYDKYYVEPFAGMLGVLLQRGKSKVEMVNDVDGNLIAWWRAVRDNTKKFVRLVENTPYCKDEYRRALADLALGEYDDPIRRALDYHICIDQGYVAGTGEKGWKGFPSSSRKMSEKQFNSIANRMRSVQINNTDAVEFLEKIGKYENMVAYCDPPYLKSSICRAYGQKELDLEAMTEALLKCRGFAAVSGGAGDWDHLDWNRYEIATVTSVGSNKRKQKRTEVLWTNRPAANVPKRTLM